MDASPFLQAFERDATPLVRTDHGDDGAWAALVAAVRTPVDVVDEGDPDAFMAPDVVLLDDPVYGGMTSDALAEAVAAAGSDVQGYALLADTRSMSEAASGLEATLVYVDLSSTGPRDAELHTSYLGRVFRCQVSEIASIAVNLSLANMDFAEFADHADARGGVFRGFDERR